MKTRIKTEKERISKKEFMMLLYYCTDNIIFFEFPFNGEIYSYVEFNPWEFEENAPVTLLKVVPDVQKNKTEYIDVQFPFEKVWEAKDEFIAHLEEILSWKDKDFQKIYRKTRECELQEI